MDFITRVQQFAKILPDSQVNEFFEILKQQNEEAHQIIKNTINHIYEEKEQNT
jgi:hypothetical protein